MHLCISDFHLKSIGHFCETLTTGAFWDKDVCVKFWAQKVNVQGHSGSNLLENALSGLVAMS